MDMERLQSWAEVLGPNVYLQAAAIALAFILIGKLADIILCKVIARIASRSASEFDDHLIVMLHRPIFISFILLGLGLATQRVGLPSGPEHITLGILKTIAIIVWVGLFQNLFHLILGALSKRDNASPLQTKMLPLIQTTAKVALFAVAVYFIFIAWDIDVTAWLASAGIIGLALSFASKDTLSNLFAGITILADAPYKVGDFITLESGERGMVTQIGLRSTRILTRDDVEITVPNGIIGNGKIINEAGGPSPKHRIRLAVGVAYGSDIDQVIATLQQIADDHPEICKSPVPRVRFRRFGDSSLDVELLSWIDKPLDRGRLSHELHCNVYKGFVEAGIEIPFPQRDIHVRTQPQTGAI